MSYQSTKTFGHELGLSCCFRQWRATHSHCQYLHGYAIAIKLVFESRSLDRRNWVVDFGGFSALKEELRDYFDHKTLVASDDPKLQGFKAMESMGVMQLVIVPAVGCEAFAKLAFDLVDEWMIRNQIRPGVRLVSVEVSEHGANSALYIGDEP